MNDLPQMLKALMGDGHADGCQPIGPADDELGPPVAVHRFTDSALIMKMYKQLDDVSVRYSSSVVRATCSWRAILQFVPPEFTGRRLQFDTQSILEPLLEIYSRQPIVIPPSMLVVQPGSADDRKLIKLLDAYESAPQQSDRAPHYQLCAFIRSIGYTGAFDEQFKPVAFNGQFMFVNTPTALADWAHALDDAMTVDLRT